MADAANEIEHSSKGGRIALICVMTVFMVLMTVFFVIRVYTRAIVAICPSPWLEEGGLSHEMDLC
jgi:hypothetical protein